MSQKILFDNDIRASIDTLLGPMEPKGVFIITDANVARDVLPNLGLGYPVVVVPAGEENKNLETLASVWSRMVELGATRRSVILNIGGGMVTDLGGFAAATFKRGVRFINVPTTLLAAVDAAVGGKTGINFGGLKNEVGAFAPADGVVISTSTFATLPAEELLSGYAEMIKHGLLTSPEAYSELLGFSPVGGDRERLLELLEASVRVKERIVSQDPTEQGARRALNLGHTAGHAFEAMALASGHPIAHGHAVALGLVVELILSHLHKGFPTSYIYALVSFLNSQGYRLPAFNCDDYPMLLGLMAHDKKNDTQAELNFTLLGAPGEIHIDTHLLPTAIPPALDIARDLLE